jgi:hypothetical protein
MKVAFLITAYKNPEQIDQFIRLWENPNFHFYIHPFSPCVKATNTQSLQLHLKPMLL